MSFGPVFLISKCHAVLPQLTPRDAWETIEQTAREVSVSHHDSIVDALRKAGIRLTPQRLLVLQAIAESPGHVDAEAIHRSARKTYPYIDIATVYRTLQMLKRLNLVTEVGLGSRLHYELAIGGTRHHHMVCDECGGAFDLSPAYLGEFRATLKREFGFEPKLNNFSITGICASCAAKQRS